MAISMTGLWETTGSTASSFIFISAITIKQCLPYLKEVPREIITHDYLEHIMKEGHSSYKQAEEALHWDIKLYKCRWLTFLGCF